METSLFIRPSSYCEELYEATYGYTNEKQLCGSRYNKDTCQVSYNKAIRAGLSWWRHAMETFSALLGLCAGNSPVTGEFSLQRPVTRSFDVFFDLCLE